MKLLKVHCGLIYLFGSILFITNCSLLDGQAEEQWLTHEDYPYFNLSEFKLEDQYKIWHNDLYSAFTDIEFFKGNYYVVFREASCCHFSDDGVIRIIRSVDTKTWESVTKLTIKEKDLRDPKLNITPSGKLTVSAAARERINGAEDYNHRTYLWISDDGKEWAEPEPIADQGLWLWRFRWNYELNMAFGFSYKTGGNRYLNLHVSQDEKNFKVEQYNIYSSKGPNESDLVFIDDSISISIVRRYHNSKAAIGISKRPFLEWHWDNINIKLASPHLVVLPDKRIVAGVRLIEPEKRTSIVLINPVEKQITEVLTLPSGGDNGYPGVLLKNNQLIVSYYSQHEGSSAIYLAKVAYEMK